MEEISKKIIASNTINKGDAIVVGFSGGPDSLCLLHTLNNLKSEMNLTLRPVHINHMFRPGDCDLEQAHAEAICSSLGLACKSLQIDCRAVARQQKLSDEEAGRLIRYQAFSAAATALSNEGFGRSQIKIAVAHNADDQAETILFRIMRGTGIHGLTGIPKIRTDENGYQIVRPLLEVSRAEINQYIAVNKLKPNMDSSNNQPLYSRNRIRLELIPFLEKEYNNSIKSALTRLAELASEEESYIEGETKAQLNAMSTEEPLRYDISSFRACHIAIKKRIAWEVVQKLEGVEASFEIINSIVRVIESDNPSARLDLPKGWIIERQYNEVLFSHDEEADNSCDCKQHNCVSENVDKTSGEEPQLKIIVIRHTEFAMIKKEMNGADNWKFAVFDFDKFLSAHGLEDRTLDSRSSSLSNILENIKVRSRRSGDSIQTNNGSKKIQDLLVDEKVPKSHRDKIKVVAYGSEILWVLPDKNFKNDLYKKKGKYSQKYQISDKAERLLFLETQ